MAVPPDATETAALEPASQLVSEPLKTMVARFGMLTSLPPVTDSEPETVSVDAEPVHENEPSNLRPLKVTVELLSDSTGVEADASVTPDKVPVVLVNDAPAFDDCTRKLEPEAPASTTPESEMLLEPPSDS